MLLLAHRGYHADAPENTLAAFRAAVAAGADGVETDLRLSADGQAVLYHDRLAPDGRPVAELSRDELSRAAGYVVPTLPEALAALPDVFWNLELKTPAVLDVTAAALAQFPRLELVLVTSFVHPMAAEAARRCGVEAGLLIAHRPLADEDPRRWFPAGERVRTMVCDYNACDLALVERSAAAGLRVLIYGPATEAELAEVAAWPLAGVITDWPTRFRR
jgi:glycerophosphoryl diester phosphodiesterase